MPQRIGSFIRLTKEVALSYHMTPYPGFSRHGPRSAAAGRSPPALRRFLTAWAGDNGRYPVKTFTPAVAAHTLGGPFGLETTRYRNRTCAAATRVSDP